MEAPAYTVDVRSILEELGGTFALDAQVDLPSLVLGTEMFTPLKPAHLDATITNTGAGIVASGEITAVLGATCSRCLRDFPLTVTAALEGFYVTPGHDREIPEEQEFDYITDGHIDLMEQILAAIVLELPFAPLHDEACRGICPQCGADLSEGDCECEKDTSDSPFAALKDLLPPGEET